MSHLHKKKSSSTLCVFVITHFQNQICAARASGKNWTFETVFGWCNLKRSPVNMIQHTCTALWKRWQKQWKIRHASCSLKDLSSSQKKSTRALLLFCKLSSSSWASSSLTSATWTKKWWNGLLNICEYDLDTDGNGPLEMFWSAALFQHPPELGRGVQRLCFAVETHPPPQTLLTTWPGKTNLWVTFAFKY